MDASASEHQPFDAAIVGAGFTGLYMLWSLRKLGMRVRVIDAASGVGGTRYWNCYPGARTDSPSSIYQYRFSEELLDEWNWDERYVGQAESERYFNHVADRFDPRKDISFGTRVDSATWNEATARWPREGIDLKGQCVGVIGTGATGIQVIQTIAPEAGHLTVFQRTANYAAPMTNPRYSGADHAAIRARHPQTRETIWRTFAGFDQEGETRAYFDLPPAERRAITASARGECRWRPATSTCTTATTST